MSPDTDEVVALDDEEAIPLQSKPPPKPFDSDRDATIITSRTDLENQKKKSTRGPDWDASPTQNTVGNIAEEPEERKTRVGAPPISAGHPSAITQAAPRSSQAPQAPARENPRPRASPSIIPHDDSIQTCQAVRVVVWRDAQGVHVAPAGTVVSAIKIDAVLVALEPTADLTAWLSRRDR